MKIKTVEDISTELKDELGQIEMDVLTNFTLSDAIRLGATKGDQAHGAFYKQETFCALQAAEIAGKALGWIKG
jgi:hypothetical protein